MNIGDLLTSKRVWGVAITGLVMLLAHFHIIVSTDAQAVLVDNAATVGGAAWTIITKIIDSKKAVK